MTVCCRFNHLLSRRGTDHVEDKKFKDRLLALRKLCLRSFPEFLANLRKGSDGRGTGYEYQVDEFHCVGEYFHFSVARFFVDIFLHIRQSSTSKRFFMFKLPLSLPYALGDGNWKMGEDIQVGKGVKTEEADHSSIIEHFVRESSPFSTSIIELKEFCR